MNIIIPLGGTGQRFKDAGYRTPKPLINVKGKPLIFWLLDSLRPAGEDVICMPYNSELDDYNFRSIIHDKYPNIRMYPTGPTKGPVETILKTIPFPGLLFDIDAPTLIMDGDTFYDHDILQLYREFGDNRIFTFNSTEETPIYSYVKIQCNGNDFVKNSFNTVYSNDIVIDIQEKIKISDIANTGCYGFKDFKTFKEHATPTIYRTPVYISDVYKAMLHHPYGSIKATNAEPFYCLGTPEQVQSFGSCGYTLLPEGERKRFCFDLDNTLVTLPTKPGDYTTVQPIYKNIQYVNYLKSQGHTIIIHTARQMKTWNGDVGKVTAAIGKITLDTLDKFNIKYDELYFGKPYADFYIDDKAISAYSDLAKEIGYYPNDTEARSFNNIEIKEKTIIKTSDSPDFEGEVYYYNNIPERVKHLFPSATRISDSLIIEKINGTDMAHLYTSGNMSVDMLHRIIDAIQLIHNSSDVDHLETDCCGRSRGLKAGPYPNYTKKLIDRYNSYDYSKFPDSKRIYEIIKNRLEGYEQYGIRLTPIHGDPVFSNIILSDTNNLKFIDMRGKVGDELTIYGHFMYDYAKLYQSIIGYDHIRLGLETPPLHKTLPFESALRERLSDHKGNDGGLDLITASLLFTLIPLHDNDKCEQYYNLITDRGLVR